MGGGAPGTNRAQARTAANVPSVNAPEVSTWYQSTSPFDNPINIESGAHSSLFEKKLLAKPEKRQYDQHAKQV